MKKIKQYFISGLFALIPISVTLYFLFLLISAADRFLGTYIERLAGLRLPGIGIVAIVAFILFSGFMLSNVIGVKVLLFSERLLNKIPIVPKVYFGIKQIVQAFSHQGKQTFNKVVLIEYPRKGLYAIGFLTGEGRGEIQEKTEAGIVNVFVPTTPNPTSGMLLFVPDRDVIYLDMSVEDGLKLIISAGVVIPPNDPANAEE